MSYTNDTKPTNSFSADTKPSSSWFDGVGYLLTQAIGFLLLESGGKIILDQSFNNKPTSSWSNDIK
jgi:hypothetical protein